MSEKLWPIEIDCDAPPYSVVQATRHIGFRRPEDVRWMRLTHLLLSGSIGTAADSHTVERTCSCGEQLPRIQEVTFTFGNGIQRTLLLGQCRRCRTVFWEGA